MKTETDTYKQAYKKGYDDATRDIKAIIASLKRYALTKTRGLKRDADGVTMLPKRETITTKISVHYVQARIVQGLEKGEIDLSKDSLREIAEKIGKKGDSPQKIKHHLEQLVKLGVIQKMYGEYVFLK